MKLPTNSITVLGLLQLFVIVGGYLMTRSLLRMWDRLWDGFLEPAMLTVPRVVAAHGLWLLAVPCVWCCIAVLSAQHSQGSIAANRPVFIAGLLLTCGLALVFSFAVLAGVTANFGL